MTLYVQKSFDEANSQQVRIKHHFACAYYYVNSLPINAKDWSKSLKRDFRCLIHKKKIPELLFSFFDFCILMFANFYASQFSIEIWLRIFAVTYLYKLWRTVIFAKFEIHLIWKASFLYLRENIFVTHRNLTLSFLPCNHHQHIYQLWVLNDAKWWCDLLAALMLILTSIHLWWFN